MHGTYQVNINQDYCHYIHLQRLLYYLHNALCKKQDAHPNIIICVLYHYIAVPDKALPISQENFNN